jgi:hypothetical protein
MLTAARKSFLWPGKKPIRAILRGGYLMNGKSLIKAALLVSALGLVGGGVFGQSTASAIKVDISFPFIINNTTLPPGEYSLREVQPYTFEISTAKEDFKVLFLTEPANKVMPNTPGELQFDEFGDKYFLSRIWLSGEGIDFYLPKSHYERTFLKRELPTLKHVPIHVPIPAK